MQLITFTFPNKRISAQLLTLQPTKFSSRTTDQIRSRRGDQTNRRRGCIVHTPQLATPEETHLTKSKEPGPELPHATTRPLHATPRARETTSETGTSHQDCEGRPTQQGQGQETRGGAREYRGWAPASSQNHASTSCGDKGRHVLSNTVA